MIDYASSLKIYPLVFLKEKSDDVMVGRPDIDSFAVFPSDGVALLQQMQAGLSPDQAAKWYEEHYDDSIDMDDFLETLRDLHFIHEADSLASPVRPRSVAGQWLGRAAFSPVAWILYAALFACCVYEIIRFPILFPHNANVFFSSSYTVIEVGLFLGQFPGILFHESFHVLAGRRLGVPSRLSIGRRMYFVVFETNLTGLWGVPSRRRYLPFLAGMLGDVIWFSLLTVIAGLTMRTHGSYSAIGIVCVALAFETALRFLWQFYFYLRTDLYYVFMNIFGCVDLHHTANRYLRNKLLRLFGSSSQTSNHYLRNKLLRLFGSSSQMEDETLWNPQDRRLARWYAPFYIFGYMLTIALSLSVGLPIAYQFLYNVFEHLINGYAHPAYSFWDSVVFLGLNGIQFLVIITILWHEYRKKKRQRTQAAPSS